MQNKFKEFTVIACQDKTYQAMEYRKSHDQLVNAIRTVDYAALESASAEIARLRNRLLDFEGKTFSENEENARLREALEFYGELKNHQMIHESGDGFVNTSNIDLDVGRIAREALNPAKPGEGEKL